MKSGRLGLWFVLGLALALRLVPMICERQVSNDAVEYQSIAENLRAGRGFRLDIKAYWASDMKSGVRTPVVHYGFYERPIMMPVLLAALRLALPMRAAAQLVGPLLFLLALVLLYDMVRGEAGAEAAFSVGVLLALHPGLFDLSLFSLAEPAALFALALIAWSHIRMRSPLLTGIACSAAFMARPSMLMFTAILGVVYLVESIRMRSPSRLFIFAGLALVGPFWTLSLNRMMGAPLTMLPQSFLFRLMSFQDYVIYFHRGEFYPSTAALLHAHGREVVRLIGKNILNYAQAMIAPGGLALLIALAPIGLAGLAQARPLRRFWLLALFAAADLGLYIVTWSTFDAMRFLSIFYLVAIVLITVGVHEVLDREPLLKARRAWWSGAMYAVAAVAAVWFLLDAGHGYLALRKWQLGRRVSDNVASIWLAPGVQEWAKQINEVNATMKSRNDLPIVASNEPWLVYDQTRLASGKLPYDLRGAEWLNMIKRMDADLVMVHEGSWPSDCLSSRMDLYDNLRQAGWTMWFSQGSIKAWKRPI